MGQQLLGNIQRENTRPWRLAEPVSMMLCIHALVRLERLNRRDLSQNKSSPLVVSLAGSLFLSPPSYVVRCIGEYRQPVVRPLPFISSVI